MSRREARSLSRALGSSSSSEASGNQDRQQAEQQHDSEQQAEGIRAKDRRDLNAVEREKLAVSLRMQGCDFDRIADECGYGSRASAYKAWKRALARIPAPAVADARKRMASAYDAARQGLWPQFIAGDTEAVKAWVLMDKSERELFGLDVQHKAGEVGNAPTVVIRSYGSPDSPVNTDLL